MLFAAAFMYGKIHHLVSDGEPDAEFSIGSGADNFPVAR